MLINCLIKIIIDISATLFQKNFRQMCRMLLMVMIDVLEFHYDTNLKV